MVLLLILIWVRSCDWINQDTQIFELGYGKWNPTATDFVSDLRGAIAGGAAGWCFHNGAEHDEPEGRPRRSFDLREKCLFDQLDPEERAAIQQLAAIPKGPSPNHGR